MLYAQKTGNKYIYFHYDENGTAYGFTVKEGTTTADYYYMHNLQGDVIGIFDSVGEDTIVRYTYDEWGKALTITGDQANTIGQLNPIRYRGYYYDTETGFYYCRSRYYDPETGRFINADGYVSTGQGILSNNMFAYCLNNPINFYDPYGTDCICLTQRVRNNHVCKDSDEEEYALYDSRRFFQNRTFRERLFVFEYGSGLSLSDDVELGANMELTVHSGCWETNSCDLSLVYFGEVELGVGIHDDFVGLEAMASLWSPSVGFEFLGLSISLGVDVGTYGVQASYKEGKVSLGLGTGLFGFSLVFSKEK